MSAWGKSWGKAWGKAWGSVSAVVESVKGGWTDKRKTLPKHHPWIHFPDNIGEIKPELADAVIAAVEKVAVKRKIPNPEIDTAKAERDFKKWLKSQQMQWDATYAQLIQLEYERREQEAEDAHIAMLMFEM